MKEVYDRLLDLVDDGHADLGVAQLVLGLALEHRCLDLDGYCSHNTLTHILRGPCGLLVELLDSGEDSFLERSLMGSAVACVLSVDIGEIGLAAELTGMGEGELDHLPPVVDYLVNAVVLDLFLQKVQKSVLALEDPLVVIKGQARVQVAVIVQSLCDEVIIERVGAEDLLIRDKLSQCPVGLVGLNMPRRTCPHGRILHGTMMRVH